LRNISARSIEEEQFNAQICSIPVIKGSFKSKQDNNRALNLMLLVSLSLLITHNKSQETFKILSSVGRTWNLFATVDHTIMICLKETFVTWMQPF